MGEVGLFIKASPLSPCHLHQRSVFIFWRPKDFFPNTAVDPYLSVQEKLAEMEGTPLASDYLREWGRFFENRRFSHLSDTCLGCSAEAR